VGAVYRTSWGSRLPYQMNIETRVLRAERPRLIEVEAQGDVLGRGEWRLSPWGGGTRVRYCWEVGLARPWMRRLALLLHPVFAWNHHQVMAAGAVGMAKALGTGPPEYRPVPASQMPPMPPAPSDQPATQSQPEERSP
jgi:hypothetical protein